MRNIPFYFLLFLLILSARTHGQNLVPNPSFETYTSCPEASGLIQNANPWISGANGTPDHFHTCPDDAIFAASDVPNNFAGKQYPNTGNGYAGIITGMTAFDWKEYLSIELTAPLEAGTVCQVSFYVSLGDFSSIAGRDLGCYLSPNPVTSCPGLNGTLLDCYTPQVVDTNYILDTAAWVLISDCFIADGGEQFLTIGNFEEGEDYVSAIGSATNGQVFYYIDDVSVYEHGINPLPDTAVCESGSIVLDASTTMDDLEIIAYSWQDGSPDSALTVFTDGLYWVDLTFSNGCTIRDSILVIPVDQMDIPFLGNDTSICDGEQLVLTPSIDYEHLVWFDNSTDSSYIVRSEGYYWAHITLPNGCVISDTIFVDYGAPIDVYLGNDTNLCYGNDLYLDAGLQNVNYFWQDGSSDSTQIISETGLYWLEVIDSNYCYTRASIYVDFYESSFPTDLLTDTNVKFCEGETLNIQLPEDDNINYLWYDGSTAADRIFTNPGIYWLEFSDSCFNYMDTMYVGGCRTDILMPNIFSPNGDGFNDFFAPDFISNISKARVQIYDRWGKVIFETEDILEGWDGTHKGTLCQTENYIWYIDALAFDGKEYIFHGNVVLIR